MVDVSRIRTVSALPVTPDGRLVLQLRDDKPGLLYPNCWATLGGRIEEGETPDAALERELIEEIEFCPPLRFWRTWNLDYPTATGRQHSEVYVYAGSIERDLTAIHLHEGQRLAAFGATDIPTLPCAFGLEKLFTAFFAERPLALMRAQIAPATLEQAPLVHTIMRSAFAEYIGVLNPPSGANRETVDDVLAAMAQGGAALAWSGETPVGSARYEVRADYLYVGRVSVLPAWRGKGVGVALMGYMEDLARGAGRSRIQVSVRMSLPSNLSFYQKLGYQITTVGPHPKGGDEVATLVKTL
jgi:GNAT superfamily N-acetyltransferase/8-oxo-dGTP pyrophosphatase MutT (NUDIX family)